MSTMARWPLQVLHILREITHGGRADALYTHAQGERSGHAVGRKVNTRDRNHKHKYYLLNVNYMPGLA